MMDEIGGTLFQPVLWLIRTLGDVVLNIMQKLITDEPMDAVYYGGGNESRKLEQQALKKYSDPDQNPYLIQSDDLKEDELPIEMLMAIDYYGTYWEGSEDPQEWFEDEVVKKFAPNHDFSGAVMSEGTDGAGNRTDGQGQVIDENTTAQAVGAYTELQGDHRKNYTFVYKDPETGKKIRISGEDDEKLQEIKDMIGHQVDPENYEKIQEYNKAEEVGDKNTLILNIKYSPIKIFTGGVKMLDVNFINPKEGSVAEDLQSVISSWYLAFRNLAALMLLSVLVYVGIRILLSTAAGETAKYKSMLKDWLVGLCLLFFLHYMMAFFFGVTNIIVENIGNNNEQVIDKYDCDVLFTKIRAEAEDTNDKVRYLPEDYADLITQDYSITEAFGFTILYWVMIFYTIMFTWKYLKRVTYLAFLTIIAPLVAMTYPIDKLRDGSAQAYNMWFKEYIFNILIQPVHLLLFIVLISSAIDLAQKHIIYSLVALGFVLEAENIIKNFFGFAKASGGSLSSGAALTGGAIFGTAVNRFMNRGKSGGSGGGSGKELDGGTEDFTSKLAGLKDPLAIGDSAEGGDIEKIDTEKANLAKQNQDNSQENKDRSTSYKDAKSGWDKMKEWSKSKIGMDAFIAGKNDYGKDNWATKLGENLKKSRHIKGIKKAAGRYFNKKSLAKFGKRAAGAAIMAPIGLAAGLASDKTGDIFKYSGMGAVAGGFLSEKAINAGSRAKDDYVKGYYGDDYWEMAGKKEFKKKHKEYINNLTENQKKIFDNMMKVYDKEPKSLKEVDEDIYSFIKNKESDQNVTEKEIVVGRKTAEKVKGVNFNDKENRDRIVKSLKRQGATNPERQLKIVEQQLGYRAIGDLS